MNLWAKSVFFFPENVDGLERGQNAKPKCSLRDLCRGEREFQDKQNLLEAPDSWKIIFVSTTGIEERALWSKVTTTSTTNELINKLI